MLEAKYYFQLGLQKIQSKEYQEAINFLYKSLYLKRNWQTYLLLGMALYSNKEYNTAIIIFKNSLELKKHWESYLGMGWSLEKTNQRHLAVKAFKHSISMKKYWKSYRSLGKALYSINEYQSAINAFNNSLALQEHWSSYQELGKSLIKTEQYQRAVDALNKSLALRKDARTYRLLGSALERLGEKEKANHALQNYYRLNKVIGNIIIDPMSGESSGINATRELIKNITKTLSSNLFSFYPSFYAGERREELCTSWKHMIHIHIPKCAGTTFERPLTRLVQSMAEEYDPKNRSSNSENKQFLWHGNLQEKYLLDSYLLGVFQEKSLDYLQGSLFVDHGAGHSKYFARASQSGINAKKICLIRDPSQRLISHIKHYGNKISNKDKLLETCNKELFNVMHRYICDYDTSDTNEKILSEQTNHSSGFDSIDFIDISDNNLISQVKSSFLSATTLPNIVQHHRLNEGSSIAKNNSSLNQNDIEDIYHDLVSKGFLERDKQIDFEFLKKRTKERLEFPEIIHTSTSLHPITYIFPQSGNPKLMRTKDFLADPLGAINARSA